MIVSSTTETPAELLTLKEAAKLCNVSDRTLWQWAVDGISPAALRIGKGTVRYSRAAYIDWISRGCPRCDRPQP
jgi:excisionase family DNA binding protein